MSPGSVGGGSWMAWRIRAHSLANDTALHSSSSFVASFVAAVEAFGEEAVSVHVSDPYISVLALCMCGKAAS